MFYDGDFFRFFLSREEPAELHMCRVRCAWPPVSSNHAKLQRGHMLLRSETCAAARQI